MIGVSKPQARLMLKVKAIGSSIVAFDEEFQGMLPAGTTDVPDDFRQAMVEVSGGLVKLYDAVLQRVRDYAKDEEKKDAAGRQPDGDMLDAGEAGPVS